MRNFIILLMLVGALACTKSSTGSSTSGNSGTSATGTTTSTGTTSSGSGSGSSAGTSGSTGSVGGVGLFTRFGGLWNGSATMTPLGDFPSMPFDMRAENDGHLLFGRVDL